MKIMMIINIRSSRCIVDSYRICYVLFVFLFLVFCMDIVNSFVCLQTSRRASTSQKQKHQQERKATLSTTNNNYNTDSSNRLNSNGDRLLPCSYLKDILYDDTNKLLLKRNGYNRRRLLVSGFVGGTTSLLLPVGSILTANNGRYIQPVSAATGTMSATTSSVTTGTTDAGEIIRRSASNIPGYGPSDVFYPIEWQGTWNVRREVIIPKQQQQQQQQMVSTSSGEEGKSSLPQQQPADVPIVLNYPIRFIQSIQDNAVVADRGFNQASLERSIRLSSSTRTTNSNTSANTNTNTILDPIRSYKWSESNPNDIFLEFENGSRKYIKITKRSYDYNSTTNIVSSSEYQRVTQDDMSTSTVSIPGSIPTITARRVVSKYKPIIQSTTSTTVVDAIEAIEIVYDVSTNNNGSNDPMSFQLQQSSAAQSQPKILSKSKLYLTRTQRII